MVDPDRAFIVIPTYWTWPLAEGHRPVLGAYDHPTPLDAASTLPPLLEDLASQRAEGFRVLILAGLAHPDLGQAASDHLRELLEPFRDRLDLRLCDSAALVRLYSELGTNPVQSELIHLGSYAGIRNLQLLVPHVLSAEAVIALDDDERVRPDYVERALAQLGDLTGEHRALGIAGPYLQPDGGMLLRASPPSGNAFRDKAHHINAALQILTAQSDRLVSTPLALGGNMVFHRDLFCEVCFDPGITRGEDIDYLINARLQDIQWWFDPQLTILHLPPRHLETPAYQRTRQDVFRFIYEREKLRLHGEAQAPWLEPYPGVLLADDIEEQAVSALESEATPEMIDRFGDPPSIVAQAQEHAARTASRYPTFAAAWRDLMARFESNPSLRQVAAEAFPAL